MNFVLSDHAREEMVRRRISLSSVEDVMAAPEQVLAGYGKRTIHQSRVVSDGKTYLLRLVVEQWHEPPVIVTLYRTSRIEKYWSTS